MNQLICTSCNTTFPFSDPRWECDGALLDLEFDAQIRIDDLKDRKSTMWRYREALPIEHDENAVSFDEGCTPLTEIQVDGKPCFVKQEHLFPTGSYKDRGASVLISRAKELGVTKMVEDSSGNAGAAVAAYAARANISCDIYVPSSTSPAKLAQIQMYGATLHEIPGSREDTARATLEAAQHHFYASHVWNPFFFHGTKTYAYEIWEQLGYQAPDTLVIPTGNGTLIIGAYIGFSDLLKLGHIQHLPRFIAVQSAHCAPLEPMFRENKNTLPKIQTQDTIAEGIAIAEPQRASQIVDIVRKTHGQVLTVADADTEQALLDMCGQGWYIEPTSATSIAAFKKMSVQEDEVVVLPLTGHGLKSTEKMLKLAQQT